MEKMFQEVEKIIDQWLPQKLNREIPRYKYIYHCQCAFVDMMIDKKLLFNSAGSIETQCLFALNYNIHLAYRYLKEDNAFEYRRIFPDAVFERVTVEDIMLSHMKEGKPV